MSFLSKLKEAKEKLGGVVLDSSKEEERARIDARMAVCNACPELRKPLDQCAKCGCFMRVKTKLRDTSCPLGKW
jgi:hypothetical protein